MATSSAPAESAALPLTVLPGIGPKRAQVFADAFGVTDLAGLLYLLPRRYREPARLQPIAQVEDGQRVQVRGIVERVWLFRPRGRKTVLGVRLADDSGSIQALFFHQPYLRSSFEVGMELQLEGQVSLARSRQLIAPRRIRDDAPEDAQGQKAGNEADDSPSKASSLEAIYPDAPALSSGLVAKTIKLAFEHPGVPKDLPAWQEKLPAEVLRTAQIPALPQAIHELHFPTTLANVEAARRRLAFGEVLSLEVSRRQALVRAAAAQKKSGPDSRLLDPDVWQRIYSRIPFQLTEDQESVLQEFRADLAEGVPMRRLLHGEVGSGKTAVAFALALAVAATGKQVALLAPTEILARQHIQTFRAWLKGASLQVRGLLGDDPARDRRICLADLATGTSRLVVGTHALFSPKVKFHKLGLVIYDEQHRFGVRQKAALAAKGKHPHVLTMTATPIPRTMAWAQYGALKPSVLRRRAGNHAEVQTRVNPPEKFPVLMDELAVEMRRGQRIFLVAPRIDGEGGLLDLHRSLSQGSWTGLPMACVHGRMSGAEVEAKVQAFREGRILALLGTSIVEVGLDVPGIRRMVVLGAERFGLASLHQLRGRLARGKGAESAICDIIATETSIPRLECLERCGDGFQVAELDLEQRGPGTLRGVAQHGHRRFQVFDPQKDAEMLDLLHIKEIGNWLRLCD